MTPKHNRHRLLFACQRFLEFSLKEKRIAAAMKAVFSSSG
jgi:hypothetical protein